MGHLIPKTHLALYGAMAMPLALVGYPIAIWLPTFYASHVGISLSAVAMMLLLAKISDVITDPIVGSVSDRLRTPIGRRRPVLLLGVPILVISIWMLFIPVDGAGALYLLLCIAGMYVGTTFVGLPYGAWGAEISPDYHQRSRVTAWREQFSLIGLIVASFIPFAVEQYGDGEISSIMTGMAIAVAITAPLFAILLCLFVPETLPDSRPDPEQDKRSQMAPGAAHDAAHDPAHDPTHDPTHKAQTSQVGADMRAAVPPQSLRESARQMWANIPMRMMLGLILLIVLAEAFRNALSLFFMRGVIEAANVGTLYFIYFVAGMVAVPFWLWLGRLLGKHIALCLTLLAVAIISAINMFFDNDDYTAFAIFFIAKGACFGGLQFLPLAILADVIDVETAETGKARAGSYIAFASMTSKISTALGTFLAIQALAFVAFNAKSMTENSDEQFLALRIFYALVPAGFFLFAIIIAWRFPLTAAFHAELRERIARHSA